MEVCGRRVLQGALQPNPGPWKRRETTFEYADSLRRTRTLAQTRIRRGANPEGADRVTARLSGCGATIVRIRSGYCWNPLWKYQKAEKRPSCDLFWSSSDSMYRTSLHPNSASRIKGFRGILCHAGRAGPSSFIATIFPVDRATGELYIRQRSHRDVRSEGETRKGRVFLER